MFCQIPFSKLLNSLSHKRFILALLLLNFVLIPILVWGLVWLLPDKIYLKLGVCLVLLTPCIDYVIFFTKIGEGDIKLILISTPLLLLLQMILLPFYLWLFIGNEAVGIISATPFINAFLWLVITPLSLAFITELWAVKSKIGEKYLSTTSWIPVLMMTLVLFLIAASQISKVYEDYGLIMQVVPIYITYMVVVMLIGWIIALLFHLKTLATRTLLFSGGTRNSLVILPLALSLPDSWSNIVTAVIVTQTIIELLGELIYVRVIPKLII